MADGKIDGLFVMGQNPAVGAAEWTPRAHRSVKLKWLVVRDMVETETASFWYDSPEVERGELYPETIGTEVFLFPAAGTAEKAGTLHQHATPAAIPRTKQSTLRAMPAASPGSCTTWACG